MSLTGQKFKKNWAVRITIILNNNAINIPIFKAFFCRSILFRFLVIEAKATALSADNTSSNDMITGKRGASSTHLSIPSSNGVKDLRDAESIKIQKKTIFTVRLGYVSSNNSS